MLPTDQHIVPEQFPSHWLGVWSDPIGRTLTIEPDFETVLRIHIRAGGSGAPYPIPGRRGETTENLRADFRRVLDFYRLQMRSPACSLGSTLAWDAYVDDGGRLRFAQPGDPGARIWLQPRIVTGLLPGENPMGLGWAYPLGFYRMVGD